MIELHIFRITSNPKGTFGEFRLIEDNKVIFSGTSCEPAGEPSALSGQNKPICLGSYNAAFRLSPKFSAKIGDLKLPILSSSTLSEQRCILIHQGNYATNTEGCILLGEDFMRENSSAGQIYGVTNSVKTIKSLLAKINEREFTVRIFSAYEQA